MKLNENQFQEKLDEFCVWFFGLSDQEALLVGKHVFAGLEYRMSLKEVIQKGFLPERKK